MKRGQVTQFIITGLIILIAVVLVLVARFDYVQDFFDVQRSKLTGVASEVELVKEYINTCLKDIGDDGITLVMLQGGYLYPNLNPGIYREYSAIDIAYWYYGKKDLSPNIDNVKDDIEIYIDEVLPGCIDSISIKDEFSGYNISYDIIKTNVIIKDNKIIFNSNVDLDIGYKGKTYKIDNVISSIESDAIGVFNSAKMLFEDIKLSRNKLNLNKDYKYNIDLFYSEDDPIYSIYSDNTIVNFAVGFPEEEEEEL